MLVQIYYFHSVDTKHKNGYYEECSGHWGVTLSEGTNMYHLGLKMVQRCVLGLLHLVYHPNDSFIYFFLREDVIKFKKAIIK